MVRKKFIPGCLLAALLAACSAVNRGTQQTSPDLSGKIDADAMLAAHNRLRREVGVAPLRWSARLEQQAAAWATELVKGQCKLKHNRIGQNLFWLHSGGQLRVDLTADAVVDFWAGEQQWYDYKTNGCRAPSGQTCLHYTQMIWRSTREIGCARRVCPEHAQVWVCNYAPAGNVIGHRPY